MTFGKLVTKYREAKGWSKTQLARAVGCSQAQISEIEADITKHSKFFIPIIRVLKIPLAEVPKEIKAKLYLPGVKPQSADDESEVSGTQHLIDNASPYGFTYDFPVYYSATWGGGDGKRGVITVSTQAAELKRRPGLLVDVADSYGLRVSNTTMEPAYRIGDVLLLSPGNRPTPDSYILLRSEPNQEPGKKLAMLALFLSETDTHWGVRQYNPASDFSVPKADWPVADHVEGKYNRP